MFLTNKITTELPGKFIKEIDDEQYQKFFQSNMIVKNSREISFNEFKFAFENQAISSEKETRGKIIDTVIEKMPSLLKLSNGEIDLMISTMNTPQGYAMRDMIKLLLENIGDITDNRAEEIGLSCFDHFVKFVDLNKKMDDPKISMIEMN